MKQYISSYILLAIHVFIFIPSACLQDGSTRMHAYLTVAVPGTCLHDSSSTQVLVQRQS
jgi:hypothetical protein